jgi:hypothetical protein
MVALAVAGAIGLVAAMLLPTNTEREAQANAWTSGKAQRPLS